MRKSTALLIASLIGSNAAWLYANFDQGVTTTYREQELYELANRSIALSTLANETVRGRSKDEVWQLLTRLYPEGEPYETDVGLHTLWIELPLGADGNVVGVAPSNAATAWARPASEVSR